MLRLFRLSRIYANTIYAPDILQYAVLSTNWQPGGVKILLGKLAVGGIKKQKQKQTFQQGTHISQEKLACSTSDIFSEIYICEISANIFLYLYALAQSNKLHTITYFKLN